MHNIIIKKVRNLLLGVELTHMKNGKKNIIAYYNVYFCQYMSYNSCTMSPAITNIA